MEGDTGGAGSWSKELTRIASFYSIQNGYVHCTCGSFTALCSNTVAMHQIFLCTVSSSFGVTMFFWCCFQTDGECPNTLVVAQCEVVKPRTAAAEHISQVCL